MDALRMTIPTENHMPCNWPLCTMVDSRCFGVFNLLILQHRPGFSSMCRTEIAAGDVLVKIDAASLTSGAASSQVNSCLHESFLSG